MADDFHDTFTEASDTDLSLHTPDTGNGWTTSNEELYVDAGSNSVAYIGGGGSADTYYLIDPDIGSADHELEFTTDDSQSGMSEFMPSIRLTDFSNAIFWEWVGTGGIGERVRKIVSGTVSNIINSDGSDVTAWIKVSADGDTIELFGGADRNSYSSLGSTTETFNNTETGLGIRVRSNTLDDRTPSTEFAANSLAAGGTTDNAVITSATSTPLSSTDTSTATDNAAITAAVASAIASTDTSSATDSAQSTSVTAAVLSGTAQAIASDAAAIVTASATPLTSTETTDSANNVTENALITTASAATLTATEASQSSDQASITAASITIQASAETATALDNALIVNAQGSPIASIESVQTDANITTLTVTPLTSAETTGTAQILLGTPVVTPALSGEPNVVPVLSASPEVVAQLRASLSIKPE